MEDDDQEYSKMIELLKQNKSIILPRGKYESEFDFRQRLGAGGNILPRGKHETDLDFSRRLRAAKQARKR